MPVSDCPANSDKNGISNEKVENAEKAFPIQNDDLIPLWDKAVPNTQLEKFKKVIEDKYNLKFDIYWDFHEWSVKNFRIFWGEVWKYFGIIASKPYEEVFVKTGPKFLDVEWFKGATMNYAENLLRIRDDRVALLYADEEGGFETITFAEMFEEVKLYAAAFRANGLQIGDRVAFYMSNRKEAVFAYLATLSVGAIWGGPQPYYGPQAAANIIRMMDAKFLVTVDRHRNCGQEYNLLANLPGMVQSVASLEKVIILATKESTYSKDITDIRNSCFLRDFLETGRLADGSVPDLAFEQLPANHPIMISFTSGTTGLPKGPVHPACVLASQLLEISIHWELKSGDTYMNPYTMGWTLWNACIPCLALGVKIFLLCGSPYWVESSYNMWDLVAEHRVTFLFLVTSIVDKMEKMNILPSARWKFDHLKMITIGGSPVKTENYKYIFEKIKKDVFACSLYGATESCGCFSGFDLNLPAYAKEIQVPQLGKNIRCYNSKGESVVGVRGEMVICTPLPGLPLRLWKDHDGKIIEANYFSKFPGVWSHNDEIEINPRTNGILVIGRSDDTLVQYGERFGSADIYFAIHNMEEIEDYLCVGQNRHDGDTRAVLFVKMGQGFSFTPEFRDKVADKIEKELWTDCVPQLILPVQDIPYNLTNKKMEGVVRKIVATNVIPEVQNIINPDSLNYYCDIPEIVEYNKH